MSVSLEIYSRSQVKPQIGCEVWTMKRLSQSSVRFLTSEKRQVKNKKGCNTCSLWLSFLTITSCVQASSLCSIFESFHQRADRANWSNRRVDVLQKQYC